MSVLKGRKFHRYKWSRCGRCMCALPEISGGCGICSRSDACHGATLSMSNGAFLKPLACMGSVVPLRSQRARLTDSLTETDDGKRFIVRGAPRPAGQSRPARNRRRAAADRAQDCRRLTVAPRNVGAKPPSRR